MIVLDASVVIAHLGRHERHSTRAFEVLDTEEELAIHPLNLAETLVHPAQDRDEVRARDRIAAIGIQQLTPPSGEPLELARLRADTGLKLPDCCALAAAVREGATLATFDALVAEAARGLGLAVVGAD